jgi:rod shape-determining protein MreC
MQNLIQFLLRSGYFFLFIGLELICFALIIRTNEQQGQLYFQYSSNITGQLSSRVESFMDYWKLSELNDSLLAENARLRHNLYQEEAAYVDSVSPAYLLPFEVIPARIVKNSVNARNNYLVIDRGSESGVHKGMGVLHDDGPVGIVIATSKKFAKVLSVLHSESMISASLKRNNYFGALVWRSTNPVQMRLEAVPKHALVQVGDTVVTSGQSAVFPRDIVIGTVDTFWIDRGSSFYSINVSLNVDIGRLDHVYVLDFAHTTELDSLDRVQ